MPESFKHSYKIGPSETTALAVYNVGYQQCGPEAVWGPGVRDHFLIHHILSGRGSYRSPSGIFSLGPGDTFLVYPDTEVFYSPVPEDPWEYCWVGFSGSDARLLLDRTGFTEAQPVLSEDFGTGLRDALLDIYQSRGQDGASLVRMTGKLYEALALLIEKAPAVDMGGHTALCLRRARQFIAYNYSRPISVEDIAAAAEVSRSSLYRVFMESLGESPKEYLTRFRIRRACGLLRDTALSVGAISNSAGFSDSLYFSRVFRQFKNMTPTEYRQSRREK